MANFIIISNLSVNIVLYGLQEREIIPFKSFRTLVLIREQFNS